VTFYKPLDAQMTAQFIVDMEWTVPANADKTKPLLPETAINYEATSASPNIPLRWCPDLVTDAGSGYMVVADIATKPALDQDGNLEGTQFACLISSDATDLPGGQLVTLTQQMYLYGDARMSIP